MFISGLFYLKSTFDKNEPTLYTSVSVLHKCFTETSLSSITRIQHPCFIVLFVRVGIPCLSYSCTLDRRIENDIFKASEVVGRRPSPFYSMHTLVLRKQLTFSRWKGSVKRKYILLWLKSSSEIKGVLLSLYRKVSITSHNSCLYLFIHQETGNLLEKHVALCRILFFPFINCTLVVRRNE